MKNLRANLKVVFVFTCLMFHTFSSEVFGAHAGAVQTKTIGGDIVAVWLEEDNSSNFIIRGATGAVTDTPGSWNITTISSSISSTNNSEPSLFSNANGDVVVLWQYVDTSTENSFLAAAILPVGAGSWNAATVSTSSEYTSFYDHFASIDETGNILATWSSYDLSFTTLSARGATATVGTSTTWNTPYTIAP